MDKPIYCITAKTRYVFSRAIRKMYDGKVMYNREAQHFYKIEGGDLKYLSTLPNKMWVNSKAKFNKLTNQSWYEASEIDDNFHIFKLLGFKKWVRN